MNMLITILILPLIFSICAALCYKSYERAGYARICAFIPYYNLYILSRIIGWNKWWCYLLLIFPYLNFFMAMLSRKGSQWQAMGYWVEHTNADRSNDNRKNYAVSIDALESLTGIDFFCNLPDDIETKVEKSFTSSYWFK